MEAILIIAIALISSAHCLSDKTNEDLARMSREIASKHFYKSKCVAIITEDNSGIMDFMYPLDLTLFHVHLPLYILKNSERLPTGFESYDWDSLLLDPMDAGCLAFIIHTPDIWFMVTTFARLAHSPNSTYRANRKYLYIPTRDVTEDEFETLARDMYSRREMDFMPDLVIAKLKTDQGDTSVIARNLFGFDNKRKDTNIKVELITHRYQGPEPSERVSLDTWDSDHGFLYNADLYPDKVTNLMGKQLNFTAISYPPVSVIFEDVDAYIYDGVEFQMMNEWSKQNNFTWKVVYEPDEWWGAIWENGSGTGISGHVSMDMADVGFTAIYLWENEYRFTDYSAMYFRTSLTTVMPRPKLLPGWLTAIHPFNKDMWIAVAVSVIGCSTLLHVTSQSTMKLLGIGRGKAVVNMYFHMGGMCISYHGLLVLQVPPDERDFSTPRHVPMRHLVTWLILFFFVLTTGYSAGLASVLTLPRYEAPIETPIDMADRNVKFGGSDIAYVFFLQKSLDPKMRKVAVTSLWVMWNTYQRKQLLVKMGFAIERMRMGPFYLLGYGLLFAMIVFILGTHRT